MLRVGVALLALSGGEVRIQTAVPTPDCPPVEAVSAALRAQPELARALTDSEAILFYTNARRRPGLRTLTVEIRDRAGDVRLSRRIDVEESSCSSADDTIILILDRYFRDLGGAQTRPPAPVLRAEARSPARPVREPPRGWRVLVAGGLGYRHDDVSRVQPLAGVELRNPAGIAMACDAFLLPASREEAVGNVAEVSASAWSVMLGAGPMLMRARIRASILPAVLLDLQHAEGSRDLLRAGGGWRLMTALGGRAAAGLKIRSNLELSLTAGVFRSLPAGRFRVAAAEVLSPPAWHAFVTARIEYAFGS